MSRVSYRLPCKAGYLCVLIVVLIHVGKSMQMVRVAHTSRAEMISGYYKTHPQIAAQEMAVVTLGGHALTLLMVSAYAPLTTKGRYAGNVSTLANNSLTRGMWICRPVPYSSEGEPECQTSHMCEL